MEDVKLYSLAAASLMLCISKQTLYNLVSDGELLVVKIGKRSKIPGFELKRFLADKLQRENIVEPEINVCSNIHRIDSGSYPKPAVSDSDFKSLLTGT